MKTAIKSNKRLTANVLLPGILVCLLVALAMIGWLVLSPFTIGNDYAVYQVSRALDYRFFSIAGVEPLWFPYLEGGAPAGFMSMAQIFHLPAWLLSQMPSYWQGGALELLSLKHIALFALAHFATFWFLREHCKKTPALLLFVCSFAIVYQLRSLDALRYGTSLDAMVYAQCLFLTFVHFFYKPGLVGFLLLIGFTQLLFTAGYEPVIAFSALAFGVGWCYLLLQAPETGNRVWNWQAVSAKTGMAALAAGIGIALSAPYLFPFIEALQSNFTRSQGSTLAWANAFAWNYNGPAPRTIWQVISNFVAPWQAEVHSGFGGSILLGLLTVTALIYFTCTWRKNWVLLLGLMFPIFYAAGTAGGIFSIFYHYVPGFSNMRVPGRIFTIFPLLMTLSMMVIFRDSEKPAQKKIFLNALKFACYLLTGLALLVAWKVAENTFTGPSPYTPVLLNPSSWERNTTLGWLLGSLAVLAIVSVAVFSENMKRKYLLRWFMAGVIAVVSLQTGYLMRHGTWVSTRHLSTTLPAYLNANHLPLQNNAPFAAVNYLDNFGTGFATSPMVDFVATTRPVSGCFFPFFENAGGITKNVVVPWYVTRNLLCAQGWNALAPSEREQSCQAPVFAIVDEKEELCNLNRPPNPSAAAFEDLISANTATQLLVLTPNLIEIETHFPKKALLATSLPFLPNWSVSSGGQELKAIKINGGLIGVVLEPGKRVTQFRFHTYWPLHGYKVAWFAALLILIISVEATLWKPFALISVRYRVVTYIALIGLSIVIAFPAMNRLYLEQTTRKILLRNDYDAVLQKQLVLWETLMPTTQE